MPRDSTHMMALSTFAGTPVEFETLRISLFQRCRSAYVQVIPAELPVLQGKGVAVGADVGTLVGVRVAVCAAVSEMSSNGESARQTTVRTRDRNG